MSLEETGSYIDHGLKVVHRKEKLDSPEKSGLVKTGIGGGFQRLGRFRGVVDRKEL
jgi:hypothetical protein